MPSTMMAIIIGLLLYASSLLGVSIPKSETGHSDPTPVSDPLPSQGATGRMIVTARAVAVHESPGSTQIVATLAKGDTVEVLAKEGPWSKVLLRDGTIGYMASFALARDNIQTPPGALEHPYVLGYFVTDQGTPSLPSLVENVNRLSAISPWAFQVTPDGGVVPTFSTLQMAEALQLAGKNKLETLALVHNYTPLRSGKGAFNPALAEAVLATATSRHRTIQAIVEAVTKWGMSGVQLDFENVRPADRERLTHFVKELSQRLRPLGLKVTMAVPAKTADNPSNVWNGAFDYAALAPWLDAMILMTYDEHHPGGPPGPIASIGWVERVVAYALRVGVPANKLVLGLPAYGYDWDSNGEARSVTYQQAMRLAASHQVSVQWDERAGVPTFRYPGHQVWFENSHSLARKVALVKTYRLRGVALWRLGQEDPALWRIIP